MSAAIVEATTHRDAIWFACHPGRTVRVRGYVEGELPASMPYGDGIPAIIVQQIHPGVRARLPVYLNKMPPDTERAAASVLRSLLGRRQA